MRFLNKERSQFSLQNLFDFTLNQINRYIKNSFSKIIRYNTRAETPKSENATNFKGYEATARKESIKIMSYWNLLSLKTRKEGNKNAVSKMFLFWFQAVKHQNSF